MMYEFKVSEMAEEFGVHRNTIRNWINAGTLQATEGPGRKYLMKFDDYQELCEKFGRKPHIRPNSHVDLETVKSLEEKNSELPVVELGGLIEKIYDDPNWGDACLTCGTCASACPISGVDSLDPRKIVRMAFLGMEDDLIKSDWPWKCTMCAKCEHICPANIEIVQLIRKIRSRRKRDLVPGPIHRGVTTCLERGNNLGIPKEDFIALLEGLGQELAAETCPGFVTPIDAHGARILMQVNSKEPFAEPDDLKWWWKIFHAAGESWTISSENWEGVNWGLFSGDDASMKTVVGRIVDNMRRLNCEILLLPESGHAYYATRYGLNRWYPDALKEFKICTLFDLLQGYIHDGKIQIDQSRHPQKTVYHDPCNYGRKSLRAFGQAYFEEGREITRACCLDVVEMEPNKGTNYCCGAGGGAWAMPFSAERIYYGRMKARQITESEAELVVTACHGCRDQLQKSLIQEYDLDIDVKYLWELVADSLILPGKA
jgi:excisionase family DNA binding protein